VLLTEQGHVSEGSACNIFLVKGGQLHTPRAADDILEGITRAGVIELAARELRAPTQIRAIDRAELFDADEVFFTGTGVQIVPVTQVDRRAVGSGEPGPVTLDLQRRYFAVARGNDPAYVTWVTAV
jgi:branched-chain amino acid aminotransferase